MMNDTMGQLEAERVEQVDLKDCTIAELRDVVRALTSDPALVVDQIRRAYVTGVRSPAKLRPQRLTDPSFRAPSMPELIPEAFLSTFEYAKLRKIVKSANTNLPGDQKVLECIQTMSQSVLRALQDTDSPDTEEEAIARVRALLRFVLDAREKCAWGDYVRPSQQHVEGPDISPFSTMLDTDRALSHAEARELEELSKQQDAMDDPMALKVLMEQLSEDCEQRLGEFDAKKEEVNAVHIANFQRYQANVAQSMAKIRQAKTYRVEEEYADAIKDKEIQLLMQKGELADVLSRMTRTMEDINELEVCQNEVADSLERDEAAARKINADVEDKIHQLEHYEYALEKRKKAIASVGLMEQDVLSHIHDLLLERGKDLFDGKNSMLMRQFEVLPNVYCQCAIFEDL
jgi:hypothetical protein